MISKNAYSPEHSRRVYSGVNLSHCSPFSPKRPILFKDSACARWGPVRFWETWTRGLTKPLVFPGHPSLKLQLSCHWLNWPCTWGFISRLSILFRWSLCLSSCQHHTVLIAVTSWWVLKPGRENSPTLSFPPPHKIILVIWGPMEVFKLATVYKISWKGLGWEEWKLFRLFHKSRYEVTSH